MIKFVLRFFILFFFSSFLFLSCSQDDDFPENDFDNVGKITDNEISEKDNFILEEAEIENDANDEIESDEDVCQTIKNECDLQTFQNRCTAFNKILFCKQTNCGTRIIEQECSEGFGCIKGKCEQNRCSDECNPGDHTNTKNCVYWDVSTGKEISFNSKKSTKDRAEEHLKWMWDKNILANAVVDTGFKTTDLKVPAVYNEMGDSAIWTGTYLASEAYRFMETGSVDALKRIQILAKTLHLFLNVTGTKGVLCRYVMKSSEHQKATYAAPDLTCGREGIKCNVPFEGTNYDYSGDPSRDQYMGVVLGLGLAFDAIKNIDKKTTEIIRNDFLSIMKLVYNKQKIKVALIYDNIPLKTKEIEVRFVIPVPAEMVNGVAKMTYCSKETDKCHTSMQGMQEFMPDLSIMLKELTGYNLKKLPRVGSAVMLSAMFNIGMNMCRFSDKGFEKMCKELPDFYYKNTDEWGNIHDWINIMTYWGANKNPCGDHYYGNNITMEPMLNLLRLEQNKAIKDEIVNKILVGKAWKMFKTHKNTFFSYIYLSGINGNDKEALEEANFQLKGFPVAPKIDRTVDLRNSSKYPTHEDGCTNQVSHSNAVDVSDRVMDGFIWQRNPWQYYHPGNPKKVFPTADYEIVYWMGLHLNYIKDDAPNHCFKWK